jgi:hypothetical protein
MEDDFCALHDQLSTAGRPCKRAPRKLRVLGRGLCVVALVVSIILVTGCSRSSEREKPRHSPEIQRFLDKLKEIHEEMKEEEADAIMHRYTMKSWSEKRQHASNGDLLKRQSVRTKWYESTPGANEGDCIIAIYLDENGYIVGKSAAELDR